MKAKKNNYKKFRRWHLKAKDAILIVAVGIHMQPLRKWVIKWAYWHEAKAHQNHLKWYAAFTEGWKFGADANQIRKDHNYPEFDPKTAGSDEPYEQVYVFDALTPGLKIVRRLHPDAVDDGLN